VGVDGQIHDMIRPRRPLEIPSAISVEFVVLELRSGITGNRSLSASGELDVRSGDEMPRGGKVFRWRNGSHVAQKAVRAARNRTAVDDVAEIAGPAPAHEHAP